LRSFHSCIASSTVGTASISDSINSSIEAEKAFQLIVYSHLQNLFPQDKSECVLITKEEYNLLTKYKGLYLDIVGTLSTIVKQFTNS
jgi:hypothetical protein